MLRAASINLMSMRMRISIKWRRLLILSLLSLAFPVVAGEPVLVLNNPMAPPLTNAQGTGFIDQLLQEIARRAGVRMRLVVLPAERGLINANAGIEDGDLNRIAGLERTYPNLMRVPEKNMDMQFMVFTRRADFVLDRGWRSLSGYSVGIIKGWKILERNIPPDAQLIVVKDAEQLFRLLEHRRVDVVLYAQHLGQTQARALRLTDVRVVGPPLTTQEMFIYLHKKHAPLVPRIAEALRQIKADGTYARLERAVFRGDTN